VPPVAAIACTAEYAVPTVAVDGLNPMLVIESVVAEDDTVKLAELDDSPFGLVKYTVQVPAVLPSLN
jgi:hypothetical protein